MFPSPGNLPNPVIKPRSTALQADSLPTEPPGKPIHKYLHVLMWASLVAQTVKNLPAMWETQVQSLAWEDPLEREWQPTTVFLPREFHG